MQDIRVGFAMCGSFCTFSEVIPQMKQLVHSGAKVQPILSPNAFATDTRFGKASDFAAEIEEICQAKIISTIAAAEPIGPKKLLDLLIIAPCTGNTLGKLANGVFDTSVTLAAKAHLRNQRPLLIAVSTNDALTGSAKNIGLLLNQKHLYFVPMAQDDPYHKPASVVARFDLILPAAEAALKGEQLQPVLLGSKEEQKP